MRRFLTTIVCILCVLAAYAVSYGTSYKGSGYTGRIYTTSSVRATSVGSGGVVASAPMASMGSTSAYKISQSMGGGVMSGAYPQKGVILRGSETPTTPYPKEGDPGYCPGCGSHYVWDPNANAGDGGWVCSVCGHGVEEGCHCDEGPDGYCRCPIGDGWHVWLFMATMAFVYAAIKKRHSHQTETVPSRPGCE